MRLRGGRLVRAARAVVSNASAPDLMRLLPSEAVPPAWRRSVETAPLNPSFMREPRLIAMPALLIPGHAAPLSAAHEALCGCALLQIFTWGLTLPVRLWVQSPPLHLAAREAPALDLRCGTFLAASARRRPARAHLHRCRAGGPRAAPHHCELLGSRGDCRAERGAGLHTLGCGRDVGPACRAPEVLCWGRHKSTSKGHSPHLPMQHPHTDACMLSVSAAPCLPPAQALVACPLVCAPAVIDPSLAPPGKHCLHAYLPATEPWELWEGLDRRSEEYKRLKEERSRVLWQGANVCRCALGSWEQVTWRRNGSRRTLVPQRLRPGVALRPPAVQASRCGTRHAAHPQICTRAAVRKIIPDIDSRVEVSLVGTPLTHQRFLRRHRGTYGPGCVLLRCECSADEVLLASPAPACTGTRACCSPPRRCRAVLARPRRIRAGEGLFPWPGDNPIPGLYNCGDFAFPGKTSA